MKTIQARFTLVILLHHDEREADDSLVYVFAGELSEKIALQLVADDMTKDEENEPDAYVWTIDDIEEQFTVLVDSRTEEVEIAPVVPPSQRS